MHDENKPESGRPKNVAGQVSRRFFLPQLGAAGVAAASLPRTAAGQAAQTDAHAKTEGALTVGLTVNGKKYSSQVDPRTTLLDYLRETISLTGTKKGCDHGQCGACTVHVNGRRINSCLTLAAMHEGDEITTIEGLGSRTICIQCRPRLSSTTGISAATVLQARLCRR